MTRVDRDRPGGLSPQVAARVYDRIGRLQDTQAPIERAALERLIRLGRFGEARRVFELGCGTGSVARRLLCQVLPAQATYVGGDVSARMVALTRDRLAPWRDRADVLHLGGGLPLPRPGGSADRFLAAYVFDLLEPGYARQVTDEAHRVLCDGGLLCATSLTAGRSRLGRAVAAGWTSLWRLSPGLVGGCRPIDVCDLLDPSRWDIQVDTVVEAFGVPSQVVIACAG